MQIAAPAALFGHPTRAAKVRLVLLAPVAPILIALLYSIGESKLLETQDWDSAALASQVEPISKLVRHNGTGQCKSHWLDSRTTNSQRFTVQQTAGATLSVRITGTSSNCSAQLPLGLVCCAKIKLILRTLTVTLAIMNLILEPLFVWLGQVVLLNLDPSQIAIFASMHTCCNLLVTCFL